MTDRSPNPDAPRPDDVRRSLRALADESAPPRDRADESAPPRDRANGRSTPDAASADRESVVADAERAVRSAREAASFLSAGRLPDLDRAVAAATRRGNDDVAARGRAARGSLRRLDAALDAGGPAEAAGGAESATDAEPRDDHFRSGRGTVLRDTAQGPGR